MPLPCLSYLPDKFDKNDTIIIWLNEAGKSEIASKEDMVLARIKSGNPLILADLRGMGVKRLRNQGPNEAKYYNREYHNAMLSLHIGKPLPGQRVEDILTIIRFINGESELSRMPV